MRRPLILILAAALAAAALASAAGPAFAEKSAQATKVLPFLDKFLKAPADRSRLKLTDVAFPKAEGGVVIFGDGHSAPLPKANQFPYFRPADHQGAVRVKLTRAPTKVAFYDGKK